MNAEDQATLAAALLNPSVYGLAAERVQRLETHISYIFLAGPYAYKVKKAVALGFLDFRTLQSRRHYCAEELRLNRRLAPTLYLDIVAITGSPERPVIEGGGPAIEYAVKMRRFSQEQLLDALLARRQLSPAHIDQLAAVLADFHTRADIASAADAFGTPAAISQPALENFAPLRAALADAEDLPGLDVLERWTADQCQALDAVIRERKQAGFVRECHGDFHLGNIALVDGEVTLFDCLEFSANLRWIDVMSEVAFLVMDLHDKKRPDLAHRFLNRYLEITGDYAGLRVLRFYVVYRALVRAKIHALRANQPDVIAAQKARSLAEARGYIALASEWARRFAPAILITHGLSGSGKTTQTQALLESAGAVRVRSDVERKRLLDMPALARTGSRVGEGAYAAKATSLTYGRLAEVAKTIAEAGYPAIIDATFLERAQRDAFAQLAQARSVPFLILDFVAAEATLRARIIERQRRQQDASEADIAVLEHQLRIQEPLQTEELTFVVPYPSEQRRGDAEARASWAAVLSRLAQDATRTGASVV